MGCHTFHQCWVSRHSVIWYQPLIPLHFPLHLLSSAFVWSALCALNTLYTATRWACARLAPMPRRPATSQPLLDLTKPSKIIRCLETVPSVPPRMASPSGIPQYNNHVPPATTPFRAQPKCHLLREVSLALRLIAPCTLLQPLPYFLHRSFLSSFIYVRLFICSLAPPLGCELQEGKGHNCLFYSSQHPQSRVPSKPVRNVCY